MCSEYFGKLWIFGNESNGVYMILINPGVLLNFLIIGTNSP